MYVLLDGVKKLYFKGLEKGYTVGPVLIDYCVCLFLATLRICICTNCTLGWAINRISLRI